MTGILKVYVREEKLVREERSKLGNNFFFLYAPGVCAYMDATLLVMTLGLVQMLVSLYMWFVKFEVENKTIVFIMSVTSFRNFFFCATRV